MTALNSRLHNCLLTILELEGALARTHLATALQNEFTVLKQVMQRLENITIDENDVCRIEAATSRFLSELKEIFTKLDAEIHAEKKIVSSGMTSRLLQ